MSTPHLIPIKPIGEDFYEGKSHERLAEAIKTYMRSVDNKEACGNGSAMPRLIGLEGKWGSGKSNVMKLLERKLKADNYHFFTFDAWSHQEDLQRRSFLSDLTNDLIENTLLKGPTNRKVLQTDDNEKDYLLEEECSWKQRCETLVARKSFTKNSKLPIINNDSKWFVLVLFVTGLIPTLLNSLRPKDGYGENWRIAFCILIPLAIYLILIVFFSAFCPKRIWKRLKAMWRFYTASEASETTTMSISEPEPSPSEFKQWMKDVNDAIGQNKLVVVFDNMDRLPSDKIRELWSSINTFFAEGDYSNVWCIIPFDYNRLSKAFDTEEVKQQHQKDNESLTDKFIKKTFPVVFRVPEPVISDYKKMFDDYAKQAFGDITLDENVSLLYRSTFTTPNPRDVIFFINKLVTLYNQWKGEVKIENMAIYILNEKIILENPEETILNGKYLGDKHLFITDNDERKEEIAVLVYGVGKNWARQIPVKRFIEESMASQPDATKINSIVKQTKNFFSVLHDMIAELEPKKALANMIRFIEAIEDTDGNLAKDWRRLAAYYNELDEIQYNQKYNELLSLIRHNKPDVTQSLVDKFCNSVKQSKERPDGSSLYEILDLLDNTAKDINPDVSIPPFELTGTDFLYYVRRAKKDYKRFKVSSPNEEVDGALLRTIGGETNFSDVLEILVDDDYNIELLNENLRNAAVEANRTKEHLNRIFEYLRKINKGLISFDGMSMVNMKKTWDTMNHNDLAYIDIATILCVNRQQVNTINEAVLKGNEDIIFKYATTETLWELSASTIKGHGVNNLMSYCIKNKKTYGDPPQDNVLSKMSAVKDHIGASFQQMIEFVNEWGYAKLGKDDSDVSKLKTWFNSSDWVKAFGENENKFTDCVLDLYRRKLPDLKDQDFKQTVNGVSNYGGYWVTAFESLAKKHLLDDGLPKNLNTIANNAIAKILTPPSNISLSNFEKALLRLIRYSELTSVNQTGLKQFITTGNKFNMAKYKLLHCVVEQIPSTELDSLRKGFAGCLKKFKDNVDMRSIINRNSSFYESLIVDNSKKES